MIAVLLSLPAVCPVAAADPEIGIPENQGTTNPPCFDAQHCGGLLPPKPTPTPTPEPSPTPHPHIRPYIPPIIIIQEGADDAAVRRAGEEYLRAHPQDADRVLDPYLEANPRDTWALLTKGQAEMNAKDYPAARDLALRALAVEPADQGAKDLKGMAEAYIRGGIKMQKPLSKQEIKKREEEPLPPQDEKPAPASLSAVGEWQRPALVGGRPQPAMSPSQALVGQAYGKAKSNDVSAALMDLTRAIDADPKNPNAWALRANIDNKMRNYEAGKRDAAEALKLDPDNPAALRARAFAQYNLGNYALALADADKSVRLDPQNGLGHLYRGMILEKLGRMADALAEYQEAARCDPALNAFSDAAFKRLSQQSAAPAGAPKGIPRTWIPLAVAAAVGLILLMALVDGALRRPAQRTLAPQPRADPPPVMPSNPAVLEPGAVLGENYLITGVLGRGGMGVVYAADDRVLQRRVAVKQLMVPGRSPEFVERFLREARLVAKLKHPNLVQIHAVLSQDGEQYLIFEFVEGRTLDRVLEERIRFSPKETRAVLGDLCAALEYAHKERVIHRDLKPGNVMVGPDGACKIMDFGIAHQARSASNMTRTAAWGTPPYMAPEQEMGTVGPESDLFALGVIVYELLTGRRPFEGESCLADKLEQKYAAATTVNAELPEKLDAFLKRALAPSAESRPRSAREFLAELDAAL